MTTDPKLKEAVTANKPGLSNAPGLQNAELGKGVTSDTSDLATSTGENAPGAVKLGPAERGGTSGTGDALAGSQTTGSVGADTVPRTGTESTRTAGETIPKTDTTTGPNAAGSGVEETPSGTSSTGSGRAL